LSGSGATRDLSHGLVNRDELDAGERLKALRDSF